MSLRGKEELCCLDLLLSDWLVSKNWFKKCTAALNYLESMHEIDEWYFFCNTSVILLWLLIGPVLSECFPTKFGVDATVQVVDQICESSTDWLFNVYYEGHAI